LLNIQLNNLNKYVGDALSTLTSHTVLLQDQPVPKSVSDTTVAFKLKDWQEYGVTSDFFENDEPDSDAYVTEGLYTVTLSLISSGKNSEQALLEISNRIVKETSLDLFESFGFAYLKKSNIRSSPRQTATGWEQSNVLTIMFDVLVSETDTIDYFNQVEVTQIINDVDDSLIDSQTYTIHLNP
jgi:hypothetical protein